MGIHRCPHCRYGGTRLWNLKRHMALQHDVNRLGGGRLPDTLHKAHVEGAQHNYPSQHVNFQTPSQHLFNPQSSAQDPYNSFDIRLKENFKLFISGPSRCGKTFFVADLLENIETFAKEPPKKIIYVYNVWQSKFDEMRIFS